MRPETGTTSRTSPSSCTSPFSPTANCWNQGASSTRKPRRGDELTLASITAATTSASSIHANAPSTSLHCNKCGYSHPPHMCPATGQQCYTCDGSNYFTALGRQKNRRQGQTHNTLRRGNQSPQRSSCRHWGCHSSLSPGRHSCHHHSPSCSPSWSSSCSLSPHQSNHSHHQQTPNRFSQGSINIILTNSIETTAQPEGSLLTESVSNVQPDSSFQPVMEPSWWQSR